MHTPEDELEDIQPQLALMAEEAEAATDGGVPRREFLFRSLVAAAATTFGAGVVRAQASGVPTTAAPVSRKSAQRSRYSHNCLVHTAVSSPG